MTFTTNNDALSTRVATLAEVELLLQWAAVEGWNPGLDDARLFHFSDTEGFLVSIVNEQIIAGISLVKHTADQSFLGLYLCKPEYRGQGVGIATWRDALKSVDNHTIGLDGVADQQENYAKSGFKYYFGNRRYHGDLTVAKEKLPFISEAGSVQVVNATDADVSAIVKYDAGVGGFERSSFFQSWMLASESRSLLIARSGNQITGFVGLRQCIAGYKVGPWLADSPAVATQLLLAVSDATKDGYVMIDIPDVNEPAIKIAELLGLQNVFETARMYKGIAPDIDKRRLFSVATLELG